MPRRVLNELGRVTSFKFKLSRSALDAIGSACYLAAVYAVPQTAGESNPFCSNGLHTDVRE